MNCGKTRDSPEKRVVTRLKAVLQSKRVSTNLATPNMSEMPLAGFETKMEISDLELVENGKDSSSKKRRYNDKENLLNIAAASVARTLEDVSPLVPKAGKKIVRVAQLAAPDFPMSASCIDRDLTDKDYLPLNPCNVLLSE